MPGFNCDQEVPSDPPPKWNTGVKWKGTRRCRQDAVIRYVVSRITSFMNEPEEEVEFLCQEHWDEFLERIDYPEVAVISEGWARRLS